jgi:hypothetical protein
MNLIKFNDMKSRSKNLLMYRMSLLIMVVAVLLVGCKVKDLRSNELKENGLLESDIKHGKQLLKDVVELQNLEILEKSPNYRLVARDKWNRQYGMNINPWPGENNALLELKYSFGSFDGKVRWLETERKNTGYGIQSWHLYEYGIEKDPKKIEDKHLEFIIPTMQYFMELPYRLHKAPIISYMGSTSTDGVEYERVFVTWDNPEPNEHDQYVLYINKKTGLIDRTTYTIRDNFMWTPKGFYGTALYRDYREVNGILFPFQIDVYPFDNIEKKVVHTFEVESIHVADYPLKELYPFLEITKLGDSKRTN